MSHGGNMLNSMACQYAHFKTDWYVNACKEFQDSSEIDTQSGKAFRKMWEWAAIYQALLERGMLRPERKGIGFAVGREFLPSVFARHGVEIVASDKPEDDRWTVTGEYASGVDHLFCPNHIAEAEFRRLVSFQPVDMTQLDALPSRAYDFLWSSCAMEHLGTLDKGLDFVRGAMRLLKPGGVAVHTTEFNCSSNDETVSEGWNVVYRRQDLERLGDSLRPLRCGLEPLNFDCGTHAFDLDFDEPPYFQGASRHIKLMIEGHVSTSFLLIARKG